MNTNSKLQALRAALASALTCADSILNDVNGDDAALQSGAAGSGRFRKRSGHTTADLASETAQHASRIAASDNSVAAHVKAADLHKMAADEFDAAGMHGRAHEHRQKSNFHTKAATTVQAADQIHGSAGRPVVPNPKGSDPDANDKGEYDDERRRNLENSGPFATPDPETGNLKCPLCQFTFVPEDSVSGKNSAEIICPRCSGAFRTETGRALGTPSED
jgi:1,6-anhydro-N-acetylmuramate kinase